MSADGGCCYRIAQASEQELWAWLLSLGPSLSPKAHGGSLRSPGKLNSLFWLCHISWAMQIPRSPAARFTRLAVDSPILRRRHGRTSTGSVCQLTCPSCILPQTLWARRQWKTHMLR